MHLIVKRVFAILAGVAVGMIVNMGLIMISGSIIPLPEGADPSSMESLKATMHLFEPKNFIFPFLAHALGTLAGAIVAALIAPKHKIRFALGIGAFFLLGGITNVIMLSAPMWYNVVDLVFAYLPMGWLGGKIASGNKTA